MVALKNCKKSSYDWKARVCSSVSGDHAGENRDTSFTYLRNSTKSSKKGMEDETDRAATGAATGAAAGQGVPTRVPHEGVRGICCQAKLHGALD
jgi:hypothetical protein